MRHVWSCHSSVPRLCIYVVYEVCEDPPSSPPSTSQFSQFIFSFLIIFLLDHNISSSTPPSSDPEGWPNAESLNTYTGNSRFESRHRIFWLRVFFLWFFTVPSGNCWPTAQLRPQLHPSKSFTIHHSSMTIIRRCVVKIFSISQMNNQTLSNPEDDFLQTVSKFASFSSVFNPPSFSSILSLALKSNIRYVLRPYFATANHESNLREFPHYQPHEIATRLLAGQRRNWNSIPGRSKIFFLLSIESKLPVRPTQPPVHLIPEAVFRR